jgi:hypothetical protein
MALATGCDRVVETRMGHDFGVPPCTYLTNAGTRHFSRRINPEEKVLAREAKRRDAFDFFMLFANADCERIAIENPVGWVNSQWRKPDQIIHPYYFGDNAKKRTCLWLKGLPKLEPTNMLPEPEPHYICKGELCKGKKIGWTEAMRGISGGQAERAKARSKTFEGIAQAMADQWGVNPTIKHERPRGRKGEVKMKKRLMKIAGVLAVSSMSLFGTGCAAHGQRFYDQTTGRWYYKPEGIVFFNPFERPAKMPIKKY